MGEGVQNWDPGYWSISRTTAGTWLTQLTSNKNLKHQPVSIWEAHNFDTPHSPNCSSYLFGW